MHTPTLTKLVAQLKPGYIYLTLGSIHQLSSICRLLNLIPHFVFEPKRHELINLLEYYNYSHNCFIVILKELKSSTKSSLTSDYTLPANLQPFPESYTFIPLIGIESELSPSTKKAAQTLEGGNYKLLDLRNIGLDLFPFNYSNEQIGLSNPFNLEQQLIYSLLSIEGVMRWSSFSPNEIRQWFSTPGQPEPIILIRAKATSLIPYILPYCLSLEYFWHKNPSGILLKFALWVFLSSSVWRNQRYRGLTVSKNKKSETVFYFNPSPHARIEWSNNISLLLS